jgi:hypothetical protein
MGGRESQGKMKVFKENLPAANFFFPFRIDNNIQVHLSQRE